MRCHAFLEEVLFWVNTDIAIWHDFLKGMGVLWPRKCAAFIALTQDVMKLHIGMEISKQQLKIKKVKYQELLCLALDLGCAELSIPALRICVFIECYFKSRLTQTKIHFSIVEKK